MRGIIFKILADVLFMRDGIYWFAPVPRARLDSKDHQGIYYN